ncbi:MAG: DUF4392 domain-containing protein [Clostridiales bacterium]|nr:DUF4392 domain-containing protein [Clostridiales bacterium]
MKIACLNMDRLVNVAIRPQGMPRADLGILYDLCAQDGPVSYKIAQDILKQPGAHVGIFTGAAVQDKMPKGESDGPLGAAAMGRAFQMLGYQVTMYTEIEGVQGLAEIGKLLGFEAPIVVLEKEIGQQTKDIAQALDIAVCTEKVGMNAKGVQHSVTGMNRNGMRAYVDPIIDDMNAMGKLTVGIGDGGNEIGFGNVYEAARELIVNGKTCACACNDGIVTVTKVTHLFPVAISNWGAYVVCAALAIATRRPELCVTPEEERAMLMASIELELMDGGTGLPRFAIDGVSGEASVGCVTMIKQIVDKTLETVERHF